MKRLKRSTLRKLFGFLIVAGVIVGVNFIPNSSTYAPSAPIGPVNSVAGKALETLAVKGRAPKTGYAREQFTNGWNNTLTCDVRNEILQRDLEAETLGPDNCIVLTGSLHDPYTNKVIQFTRGETTSDDVQIDHVVAISDAWQKGAQQLIYAQRNAFANDPLNLLAVDGPTNLKKSDGDAATWLPPNKTYRCEYVARQVAVKIKYTLWVTQAEHDAIARVLITCPDQNLPI